MGGSSAPGTVVNPRSSSSGSGSGVGAEKGAKRRWTRPAAPARRRRATGISATAAVVRGAAAGTTSRWMTPAGASARTAWSSGARKDGSCHVASEPESRPDGATSCWSATARWIAGRVGQAATRRVVDGSTVGSGVEKGHIAAHPP